MKVLIAVDDAIFAEEIAEFVINQGWPGKTEFRVLHVIDWPLESEIHSSPVMEDCLEKRYQAGKQLCEKLTSAISRSVKDAQVEQVILNGHAAEQIVSMSHGWPADQVIVGSHGKSGLSLFLLGSVSSAVITHAGCTVTVVRKKSKSATS